MIGGGCVYWWILKFRVNIVFLIVVEVGFVVKEIECFVELVNIFIIKVC